MSALPSFSIKASAQLGGRVCQLGISAFGELTDRVRNIPYGRTNSSSPIAVLVENVGTCSSKHRLLAAVAHEAGHTEITLVIGIYEMSEANTPGVGAILAEAGTSSIPEAHCYLMLSGTRFDLTGLTVGRISPLDAVREEHLVLPEDLAESKDRVHKQALKRWALSRGVTPEKAWQIREACIAALATNHSIERTSSGRLRLPAAAPHVER